MIIEEKLRDINRFQTAMALHDQSHFLQRCPLMPSGRIPAGLSVIATTIVVACFGEVIPAHAAGGEGGLWDVAIPSNAERVHRGTRSISGVHADWDEYVVDGERVGSRYYYIKMNDGDRLGLAIEATYRDGRLHGYWKEFYENGNLFVEVPYRKGRVDGVITYWSPEGTIMGSSAK